MNDVHPDVSHVILTEEQIRSRIREMGRADIG
jgi:hypothetical protein